MTYLKLFNVTGIAKYRYSFLLINESNNLKPTLEIVPKLN